MTNHHVGADENDLQRAVHPAERIYLKDGFAAKTRAEEVKCKGLELVVLQGIQDVTDEVNGGGAGRAASPADAGKARQKKIGRDREGRLPTTRRASAPTW